MNEELTIGELTEIVEEEPEMETGGVLAWSGYALVTDD